MEIRIFCAVAAATYCAPVGGWWSLVRVKTKCFRNEATRRLAGDAYASFLIPGRRHYSVCPELMLSDHDPISLLKRKGSLGISVMVTQIWG